MKRQSLPVPTTALFTLVAVTASLGATTEALRHSYYTRRDHRGLIGPLGFPFGFLDSGHYNLTVFDFQLFAPKHKHKHDDGGTHDGSGGNGGNGGDGDGGGSELQLSDVLDNIKGVGFVLKPFEDEAHFFHYMDRIAEDPGRCIFQDFLDRTEYDAMDEYDVDDFAYSFGEYDDFPDFFDDDGKNYGDRYYSDDEPRLRLRKLAAQGDVDDDAGVGVDDDDDEAQGLGEAHYNEVTGKLDGIFLDMLPRSRWSPHVPSVAYNFAPGEAGLYFLIYQVCYNIEEGSGMYFKDDNLYDIHSRFELDFHFSNKDMFGHVSYLPRGEMNLPWLFFLFSVMYAACLYVWQAHIQRIKAGQPGFFDSGEATPPTTTTTTTTTAIPTGSTPETPTIYPIHYMMGVLLALKFSSLLFESIRFHYLRVTGHAVFFSAVYYFFAFLKGMTLFTVILLIGSGWSFVKPFLSEREKKMIFGILVLQVVNNIAIVVLTQETEGETGFDTWTALLHLVDILCCCAVLIPIVWQVNQLEKNMEQNQHKSKDDQNDGGEEDSFINNNADDHIPEDELEDAGTEGGDEAQPIPDARLAAKLKLFRSFYLLVIAYIYMTRIVVYLFATTLNYKHTWIRFFVVELTTIVFYCSVGYMFRPMIENPYTHLRKRRQGNDEGAAQVEMRKIDPSTKTALD